MALVPGVWLLHQISRRAAVQQARPLTLRSPVADALQHPKGCLTALFSATPASRRSCRSRAWLDHLLLSTTALGLYAAAALSSTLVFLLSMLLLKQELQVAPCGTLAHNRVYLSNNSATKAT